MHYNVPFISNEYFFLLSTKYVQRLAIHSIWVVTSRVGENRPISYYYIYLLFIRKVRLLQINPLKCKKGDVGCTPMVVRQKSKSINVHKKATKSLLLLSLLLS